MNNLLMTTTGILLHVLVSNVHAGNGHRLPDDTTLTAHLPSEVQTFAANRDMCDHFRGEPLDGGSPAQVERRILVAESLEIHCAGTDRRLAALRMRYADSPAVISALDKYEPGIEPSECLANSFKQVEGIRCDPSCPEEAKEVIASVHVAADKGDLVQIREMMAENLIWSLGYGATPNPDQAIAAWRADPEAMAALSQVTGTSCGYMRGGVIQCPLDAGLTYRAGSTQTQSGWRMSYFLAGD